MLTAGQLSWIALQVREADSRSCFRRLSIRRWKPRHWHMKVLIVEDEPDMLSGLRDNLEFEGYEVVAAKDGVTALEVAAASNPDLIILDVMLPRLSGLDVCRRLRAKGAAMPIIMLTARGQELDKVIGLEV